MKISFHTHNTLTKMHTQPLQTMIKKGIKRGQFRQEMNSTTVMKPKIHMKFLIIIPYSISNAKFGHTIGIATVKKGWVLS